MDREIANLLTAKMLRHPWWPKFQEAFPGWRLEFARIDGDEMIDWNQHIVQVAIYLQDPMFRMTHAIAHLVKHECARGRTFTAEEEAEADDFARFWRIALTSGMDGMPQHERVS